MGINYHIGKTLIWVPHHADDYEKQRVVKVTELREPYCAKLDNGWIVDGYGECVSREVVKEDGVISATFEPSGYVDDCL